MTNARRPKAHMPCPECNEIGRSYTFNSAPWYWCFTHGAYRYMYQPKERNSMFTDFILIGSKAIKK